MIFDIIAVTITVAVILLVIFGVLMIFGATDMKDADPSTRATLKRGAKALIKGLLVVIAVGVVFGGAGAILGHGLTTLHAWVF